MLELDVTLQARQVPSTEVNLLGAGLPFVREIYG
jgi:hypothetical protein